MSTKSFINSMNNRICIMGPALSGKTHAIAHKLKFYIEQGWNPYKIALITASKCNVEDCKQITEKVLGSNYKKLYINTVHIFLKDILTYVFSDSRNFPELTQDDIDKVADEYEKIKNSDYFNNELTMRNKLEELTLNLDSIDHVISDIFHIIAIDEIDILNNDVYDTLINRIKSRSGILILSSGSKIRRIPQLNLLNRIISTNHDYYYDTYKLMNSNRIELHLTDEAYGLSNKMMKFIDRFLLRTNQDIYSTYMPIWKEIENNQVQQEILLHNTIRVEDSVFVLADIIKDYISKGSKPNDIAVFIHKSFDMEEDIKRKTAFIRSLYSELQRDNIDINDRSVSYKSITGYSYKIFALERIIKRYTKNMNMIDSDIKEVTSLLGIHKKEKKECIDAIMNHSIVKGSKDIEDLIEKLVKAGRLPNWMMNRITNIIKEVSFYMLYDIIRMNSPNGINILNIYHSKWIRYKHAIFVNEDDVLYRYIDDRRDMKIDPNSTLFHSISILYSACRAVESVNFITTIQHNELNEIRRIINEF